jgi:hypothetical protein
VADAEAEAAVVISRAAEASAEVGFPAVEAVEVVVEVDATAVVVAAGVDVAASKVKHAA